MRTNVARDQDEVKVDESGVDEVRPAAVVVANASAQALAYTRTRIRAYFCVRLR